LAGGAHHTGYSYSVTREMLEDFATIAGIEMAVIGPETTLTNFKQDVRNNEVFYYLAQGFRA
jgi:L-arabinose isomerase